MKNIIKTLGEKRNVTLGECLVRIGLPLVLGGIGFKLIDKKMELELENRYEKIYVDRLKLKEGYLVNDSVEENLEDTFEI